MKNYYYYCCCKFLCLVSFLRALHPHRCLPEQDYVFVNHYPVILYIEKHQHTFYITLCFLCSDSGLVVPSVPYQLHKRLLAAAERWGLSLERRLEAIGVCSSQMALNLLGGPNR